jgi:endoglucanase
MGYILGNNPRTSSYVIGFGANSPKNPHHRTAHGAWYNDIDDPVDSQHLLYGALVGGPDAADRYADTRTDYVKNEVACDYNAGLFGAALKMYSLFGGSLLSNFPSAYFPPESERLPEYFVRAKINSQSATSYQIVTQTANRSAWPATIRDRLSIRYFFDISEAVNAGYSISDVSVAAGTNEGGVLSGPYPFTGNVYYLKVDFSGTAIYPAGRSECEKQFTFTITGPEGAWDPSNDYSFEGLTGSPFTYEPTDYTGMTLKIPIYDNGSLLNGIEPVLSGTPGPTPEVTPLPDQTPAPTATPKKGKGP